MLEIAVYLLLDFTLFSCYQSPLIKQQANMNSLKPSYFFDLSSFEHASLFNSCEYVWEALDKIKGYLAKARLGVVSANIPQGSYIVDPELISIGKGTVIEPGAYIKGPCIIGNNCTIRHGAYIRGNVITGDRCVIGHDTEIKNSILLDHAQAAHFAYLGDSILGNKVNLGAGTKCANLKLNHGLVAIEFEGQRVATGLRKFGAIIGDGSQLGCNSVTNPGALIGQNVCSYPCVNFGGFVPSNSVVKSESQVIVKTRK